MLDALARAAEALLWPLGIRRKKNHRGDDGALQPDDGEWEVDTTQLLGAMTGAMVAWWAMNRLKSLPSSPTPPGVGGGSNLVTTVSSSKLPLSEFLKLLRAGGVAAVTYLADKPPAGALLVKARVAPQLPLTSVETLLLPGCHQGLFEELRKCDGVLFECAEVASEPIGDDLGRLSLLIDAGGLLASVAALWYMLRSNGGQGGGFSGQKLAEPSASENRSEVTFDDVAGMESTKEELREVISFLRDPDSFYALGARPPRGILLAGPSGTGKTLMARAVAGEAGVSFLYASSASFVEIYVGQGAARIRQFFEQARSCAPCIVFLDELDAVGASRQQVMSGGNQEYAQTLNQLLLELDGIESHSSAGGGSSSSSSKRTVVTIAATNRYESLDEALVRPGRLDRIVMVSLPNVEERKATLQIHARKLQTEGLNFEALARRTEGRSGADLANILNEAALLAARRGASAVRSEHLEEVLQNPRPTQQQEQERRSRAAGPDACFGQGNHGGPDLQVWAQMMAAFASSLNTVGEDPIDRSAPPPIVVQTID